MKTVLTTGDVAKLCEVSPQTVTKWCDRGLLKSYRIPGSQARRILLTDLEAFAKKHGMPLQEPA